MLKTLILHNENMSKNDRQNEKKVVRWMNKRNISFCIKWIRYFFWIHLFQDFLTILKLLFSKKIQSGNCETVSSITQQIFIY